MNLIIMPRNEEEIKSNYDYVAGFSLGLDKLCVNMPKNFSEEELFIILDKYKDKEMFISLNKNMHNSDIEYLKEIMIRLDNYDVKIAYYDIAVVNIKKELNLKNPLVWNQEHLTNNYITSDYWYNHGALYTMVSSEITKEEVNEIKQNAKGKIILPIFGYIPMFVSKRHLIKNYLETFNLKDESEIYYLKHKEDIYPIIDKEDTIAYSSNVLNAIDEMFNINVDYYLLNSFLIKEDLFKDIVKMYSTVTNENKEEYKKIIDFELKTDRGFLDKETIYKVKP
jgi:U32 family peptidase